MTDPGVCEWDCEGCGVHVFAYGIDRRPNHGFCATCGHIDTYARDPSEFWQMYCMLNREGPTTNER